MTRAMLETQRSVTIQIVFYSLDLNYNVFGYNILGIHLILNNFTVNKQLIQLNYMSILSLNSVNIQFPFALYFVQSIIGRNLRSSCTDCDIFT